MRRLICIPFVLALIACVDTAPNTGPVSGAHQRQSLSTSITEGDSRIFLYATGKTPTRIVSIVDVTDLDAMALVNWGVSLTLFGHDAFGVDVDANGNVLLSGGWSQQSWLGVFDGNLMMVGETGITSTVPGDPLDVAFRSTNQAVVCSRVAPGNYSRLIVLDVSDLANPVQTGSAVIPGTGAGDGCRSLAFDEAGDLWVTTGGVGNLVRMTLDPTGVPISTQVTPLSFPWGAIEMAVQPGTRRLFLSLINSGHIGVVDLTNPSAPATLITNVCESTLGSPQGLEFSPAGDLFVGCSNYYGATDDLKAIPASSLVGLSETVDAASLNVRGADLGPPGVYGSDGTMAFLAIRPHSADLDGPVSSNVTVLQNPVKTGLGVPLTAFIDDGTTGGSAIATAEYTLDHGVTCLGWTP